jgi:hypothetical protein
LALAIYTIPLALLLVVGHGVTMGVLRRGLFITWIKGALIAVGMALLGYMPMAAGLRSYYGNPFLPTMNYREFLSALPRFAIGGSNGVAGVWCVLAIVILVAGSWAGWGRAARRPMLLTFVVMTVMGIGLPVVSSAATEVRFVPWILPWFCICAMSLETRWQARTGRVAGGLAICLLLGWQVWVDATLLPQQPIREGLAVAAKRVPPGRSIMVLYLAGRESIALYANDPAHVYFAPADATEIVAFEKSSLAHTGHLPWAMIYYEALAERRSSRDEQVGAMWKNLQELYEPDTRLAGRLTPVTIYRPREAGGP